MGKFGTAAGFGGVARSTSSFIRYAQASELLASKRVPGYRGPRYRSFPYRSIRLLGASQLLVALLIQIITIIQISMGYADRFIFLAKASVDVWTPLPAIAAGIVGIAMTERRYWETQCMKVAYCVLSLMSAGVFMMILLFVTGVIEFNYYSVKVETHTDSYNNDPGSHGDDAILNHDGVVLIDDKPAAHKALVGVTVALALLELILSFMSVIVICYCAPTLKPVEKVSASKHSDTSEKEKLINDDTCDDEPEVKVNKDKVKNGGDRLGCDVFPVSTRTVSDCSKSSLKPSVFVIH